MLNHSKCQFHQNHICCECEHRIDTQCLDCIEILELLNLNPVEIDNCNTHDDAKQPDDSKEAEKLKLPKVQKRGKIAILERAVHPFNYASMGNIVQRFAIKKPGKNWPSLIPVQDFPAFIMHTRLHTAADIGIEKPPGMDPEGKFEIPLMIAGSVTLLGPISKYKLDVINDESLKLQKTEFNLQLPAIHKVRAPGTEFFNSIVLGKNENIEITTSHETYRKYRIITLPIKWHTSVHDMTLQRRLPIPLATIVQIIDPLTKIQTLVTKLIGGKPSTKTELETVAKKLLRAPARRIVGRPTELWVVGQIHPWVINFDDPKFEQFWQKFKYDFVIRWFPTQLKIVETPIRTRDSKSLKLWPQPTWRVLAIYKQESDKIPVITMAIMRPSTSSLRLPDQTPTTFQQETMRQIIKHSRKSDSNQSGKSMTNKQAQKQHNEIVAIIKKSDFGKMLF